MTKSRCDVVLSFLLKNNRLEENALNENLIQRSDVDFGPDTRATTLSRQTLQHAFLTVWCIF